MEEENTAQDTTVCKCNTALIWYRRCLTSYIIQVILGSQPPMIVPHTVPVETASWESKRQQGTRIGCDSTSLNTRMWKRERGFYWYREPLESSSFSIFGEAHHLIGVISKFNRDTSVIAIIAIITITITIITIITIILELFYSRRTPNIISPRSPILYRLGVV